jgi:hypothetical protein
MVELAKSKIDDLQEDAEIFGSVFTQLDRVLGANAFRRFDPSTERYQGGFSISAFEAIAIGLAARNRTAPLPDGKVKELIQQLWSAQEFNDAWGAGISASSRIPRLVPLGRLWFGV